MLGLLKKKKDLGKTLFNLMIIIKCCKKTFEDSPLMFAQDEIEIVGLAINRAKRILRGSWHVTEQGYLVRGADENVENKVALLYIEDLITATGLETLERIQNKLIENEGHFQRPHLHFESGGIQNVGGDENSLYLVEIHQDWEESQFED